MKLLSVSEVLPIQSVHSLDERCERKTRQDYLSKWKNWVSVNRGQFLFCSVYLYNAFTVIKGRMPGFQ